MEAEERFDFDVGRGLASFRCNEFKKTLSSGNAVNWYILIDEYQSKKNTFIGDQSMPLLDVLSKALCQEQLTFRVASCFEPLLLELLIRAQASQPKEVLFVVLSRLIVHFPVASQFCYRYFKTERPFKLPLDGYALDTKPSVKRAKLTSNSEEILRACLAYLSINSPWFVEACDWSPLFTYVVESNSCDVRWLATLCIRFVIGIGEADFNALVAKMYSPIELAHLRLKYVNLFAPRTQFSTVLTTTSSYSGTPLFLDNKDFSKNVIPVCDVLLIKANESSAVSRRIDLVLVPSFRNCLRTLAKCITNSEPVIVDGPVGSGKSSLIEYVASLTGRQIGSGLIKVQLGDQIDSKLLVGAHCCTEIPGDFIWRPGPLTDAMNNGHWLVLEDIDCASADVITIVTAAIKSKNMASLPGSNITGNAHHEFRVFFTRRLVGAHSEFMNKTVQSELDKICTKVHMMVMPRPEVEVAIKTNWSNLEPIIPRILDIYLLLSERSHEFEDTGRIGLTRQTSLRDLVKWCHRISKYYKSPSTDCAIFAFLDAADCFFQSLPDINSRLVRAEAIGALLNVSKPQAEHLIVHRRPDVLISDKDLRVGRTSLIRLNKSSMVRGAKRRTFAYTQQSLALLERISMSVACNEPVLLVGETGTGKTSTVQYVADILGHDLAVLNMNQQSDSSDLLGGYKPVDFAVVVQPLRREFENLFSKDFDSAKNSKFLNHVNNCFQNKKWDDLFALLIHVIKEALTTKVSSSNIHQWRDLSLRISDLKTKCKLDERRYLVAFAYIEGSLVKAMREGKWLLLDEINLAEAETLQCLSSVLDIESGSLVLLDKADGKPVERHADFRLFACMNPATDVGKKELPLGIRNRFTEFFVDELQNEKDLQVLVDSYLQPLGVQTSLISKIVKFYLNVKAEAKKTLSDTTGHKPHFSLR